MPPFKNLLNIRFEKLKVIKLSNNLSKSGGRRWICKCDCGNIVEVDSSSLISGNTKSCGCLHKEIVSLKNGEASLNLLYNNYKYKATLKNNEFNLTKSQFKTLTSNNCVYCGIAPYKKVSTITSHALNGDYIYNGIDRYDNNIGYTLNNSKSCCYDCNIMKSNLDYNRFLYKVNKIYNNINNNIDNVNNIIYNYDINNFTNHIYIQYKYGAKRRNIPFDLDIDDFNILIHSNCHYCNKELSNVINIKSILYRYNGIDRCFNYDGYNIDNCIPCCYECNKMKMKMDIDYFLQKIKDIYFNNICGEYDDENC